MFGGCRPSPARFRFRGAAVQGPENKERRGKMRSGHGCYLTGDKRANPLCGSPSVRGPRGDCVPPRELPGGFPLRLRRAFIRVLDFGLPSMRVAMTIAGSDPSGGAGLQADLKTFHQFGVYGMAVPTLLTVQNTRAVELVSAVDPHLVQAQLECVQRDIRTDAAKTGALGTDAIVRAVARWAQDSGVPTVVDPVILSTSGNMLASEKAVSAMARYLLPACFLITPNLHEAGLLADMEVGDLPSMRVAAERIAKLGVRRVLVTGGHLRGDATDLLWIDGEVATFTCKRLGIATKHGTGCTYSAAITALLALGRPPIQAVEEAKLFVSEAIRSAPRLGSGHGPLNHHARPRQERREVCDDRTCR